MRIPTHMRLLLSVALLCGLGMTAVGTGADDYEEEIEAWRVEREASLKADDSWLTVSALFFLREGETSFGSSPRNDLTLPARVPAAAGVFELRNGTVTARAPAGGALTVNGEAVTSAQLYPAERRATLTIGSVSLWVHNSGERLAIRVRDTESDIRKNFTGLEWYPVDERYRVRGKFTPHAEPITV